MQHTSRERTNNKNSIWEDQQEARWTCPVIWFHLLGQGKAVQTSLEGEGNVYECTVDGS